MARLLRARPGESVDISARLVRSGICPTALAKLLLISVPILNGDSHRPDPAHTVLQHVVANHLLAPLVSDEGEHVLEAPLDCGVMAFFGGPVGAEVRDSSGYCEDHNQPKSYVLPQR